MDELTNRLEAAHGVAAIRAAADDLARGKTGAEVVALAQTLFGHSATSVRLAAVYLLGRRAAESGPGVLEYLRRHVAPDPDWRVQEMLAKAVDQYCRDMGYQAALPFIDEWLAGEQPNCRRAVTEGLRVWTKRPYFDAHPGEAISRLQRLQNDPSAYVRTSVRNALRDIEQRR